MFFFDQGALIRKYPQIAADLNNILAQTHNEALEAGALSKDQYYCAQSRTIREKLSRPVYEKVSALLFAEHAHTEEEMEQANARLGVNVESETNAGLVKVVSAVNVCKRCVAAGENDRDCRNVTSRMRFTRSWDEPGTAILTCQRCGHVWKR